MTTTKAKAKGDRAVTAEQLKEAVRAYADAHFPGWGLATLGIDGGTGQLGASETLLVLNADGSTKRVWARGVKPGHRAGDAVPGSETPTASSRRPSRATAPRAWRHPPGPPRYPASASASPGSTRATL